MKLKTLLLSFLFAAGPDLAWACTVCFGQGNEKLARGFYWGILMLLTLPVALFGFLATMIFLSVRRKAALEKEVSSRAA